MQSEVAGLQIEVLKKDIKNLHLYVLPPDGRVRVTAPKRMADKKVDLFVQSKLAWIKKQQAKLEQREQLRPRDFVSGEPFFVWGRQYWLQVEYSGLGNSLKLAGDQAVLTVRRQSSAAQRGAFTNEWYRSVLKEQIGRRLPEWEELTGLHCSSWQIKNMKTRWGTCNTATGKIWINLKLAVKPVECLEYVLLHELAHLKVANHGKDFAALLDGYMPRWRAIRKQLNETIL